MGINMEEEIDIQGAVFEISNEAFVLEYEHYTRFSGDVYFRKDTAFHG